jgi:flagellar basal body P-ring protein FlgI
MKRRHSLLFAFGAIALAIGGCSWFNGATMRSQSPEEAPPDKPHARLVGDIARPLGDALQPARVDTVGLVTGLHGSGSDPSPSPQRAALLEEMQARDVANPNAVLASGNVSLVLIQGYLRPGIQKGDRFDIDVRIPSQSDTTSLRGGYLLETRLTETAVLDDHRLHHGNLLALAKGPVLVDPTADPKKDRLLVCRGRILGGGVVLKSRPLGFVLLPECKSVTNSSRVANAVNKRFHTLENGVQTSMAKAKTDEFIELAVYPRYKDNIARYIQVIRALPLGESAPERMARIASLQSQLLDPDTTADAAIQLEAIGSEGEDALLAGIKSKNPEVRFYAAEALAYLDRREAAEPLAQIARDQPAFRVFALTALSVMHDFAAYEQLRDLLSLPSAETRYGAFRALWTINNSDPLVRGEMLADQFHYHLLDVAGPPMIHVTRNRLPEIVVFGLGQRFVTPLALNAGNEIMIRSAGGDEIAVSKYSVADGDQKRIVSTQVDDVIRAVVELGGTYPDVVQALSEAKNSGALASRFEIDALPEAGRSYDPAAQAEQPVAGSGKSANDQGKVKQQARTTPASPSPELFAKRQDSGSIDEGKSTSPSGNKSADDDDSDDNPKPKKGFFDRILGR